MWQVVCSSNQSNAREWYRPWDNKNCRRDREGWSRKKPLQCLEVVGRVRVKIESKPMDLCLVLRGIIVLPWWIYGTVYAHFSTQLSFSFSSSLSLSLSLSLSSSLTLSLFLPLPIFALIRNALGSVFTNKYTYTDI